MLDKHHVLAALGYGILGILLGMYMAVSKNYIFLTVHAHILLLGFIVSFVYGVCYKLWLQGVKTGIAKIQFFCHQIGTLVFCLGMLFIYGGQIPPMVAGPMIGVGVLLVLAAVIIMKVLFIQYYRRQKAG